MIDIAEHRRARVLLREAIAQLDYLIQLVERNGIPMDLEWAHRDRTAMRERLHYLSTICHLAEQIKAIKAERIDQAQRDRLFIQEIINDLIVEHGIEPGEGFKAMDLLTDWSRDLRDESGLRGRTKRTFFERVGKHLW